MITIFLLAFIYCLVSNLITNGEAYIFFARVITFMNSAGQKNQKIARDVGRCLEIEYLHAGRKYAVMVFKKQPLPWLKVAAKKNGTWIDKTDKVIYYAGPYRNFHGLGLTPHHISPKYEILAFRFADEAILHVKPDQVIVTAIRDFYQSVKTE